MQNATWFFFNAISLTHKYTFYGWINMSAWTCAQYSSDCQMALAAITRNKTTYGPWRFLCRNHSKTPSIACYGSISVFLGVILLCHWTQQTWYINKYPIKQCGILWSWLITIAWSSYTHLSKAGLDLLLNYHWVTTLIYKNDYFRYGWRPFSQIILHAIYIFISWCM